MKMIRLILMRGLIMMVLLVSLVFATTITQFNDNDSQGLMNFTGNVSQFRYLNISDGKIKNATILIRGISSNKSFNNQLNITNLTFQNEITTQFSCTLTIISSANPNFFDNDNTTHSSYKCAATSDKDGNFTLTFFANLSNNWGGTFRIITKYTIDGGGYAASLRNIFYINNTKTNSWETVSDRNIFSNVGSGNLINIDNFTTNNPKNYVITDNRIHLRYTYSLQQNGANNEFSDVIVNVSSRYIPEIYTDLDGEYPLNFSIDLTNNSKVDYFNSSLNFYETNISLNLTDMNDWISLNCINSPCNLTIIFNGSRGLMNYSNILIMQNEKPQTLNISLTPQTFTFTDLKGHANFSDTADNDIVGGNQTYWYLNGSIVNEANNSFTLGGNNITKGSRIIFSARFNDTFDWSDWVNSSEFFSIEINNSFTSNSFTDGTQINISINVNNSFNLSYINISVLNPNQLSINRTCSSLGLFLTYICNITFFDGDETSVVGIWNLTTVYVSDTENNIVTTYPNSTFEVTASGGGGGDSSGGGGGGGTVLQPIVQNITVPISNCNFNKICEFGEDFIGCPEDCRTIDRLKTDYLFCDDPSKPCLKDDIKAIFASRNVVIRLSILAIPILITIVFLPRESKLGKLFKEPLLKALKKDKKAQIYFGRKRRSKNAKIIQK